MPPVAILAIQAIQAAIAAAPQVVELVTRGKAWIEGLFSSGLISKEQQDALHARVDEICAASLRGEVPAAWTVEADPS